LYVHDAFYFGISYVSFDSFFNDFFNDFFHDFFNDFFIDFFNDDFSMISSMISHRAYFAAPPPHRCAREKTGMETSKIPSYTACV
jgi:hypothetical protein